MTAAWPTKKMSWRALRKCGATAASQFTLQKLQRWPKPAPSTATLPRCESRWSWCVWLCENPMCDARSVSPVCVLTVIKGPRSFDSCPFWKKSTIKSSTDPVAKECQWICGLPYKVSSYNGLMYLLVQFTCVARFHCSSVFLLLEFKTPGFFLTAFLS